MLKDLRDQLELTRQELAEETGRSLNYILKAEQLTFPTAPVALTDYYAHKLKLNPDVLRQAYRDAQRHTRESAFDYIRPRPLNTRNFTFCRKWYSVTTDSGLSEFQDVSESVSPSQYQVSKLLCVPASAVYHAEKTGHISEAIRTAISDLLDYAQSGRLYSALSYNEAQAIHSSLERIWEELNV